MTTIKITHAQRAFLAMELLKKEINNHKIERFKIYSTCIFIKGDTAQKNTPTRYSWNVFHYFNNILSFTNSLPLASSNFLSRKGTVNFFFSSPFTS